MINGALLSSSLIIKNTNAQTEKPEIKAMNAAQMRGIISIMSEFAAGKVPESQAIYLLSKAAGIEKDEARQLLKGDVV